MMNYYYDLPQDIITKIEGIVEKEYKKEWKKNIKATSNIINSLGKWEDYVEMELENGDATIDEIYSVFWWGDVKMSYGEWLMNCVKEAD